jgi:hypothetical protein
MIRSEATPEVSDVNEDECREEEMDDGTRNTSLLRQYLANLFLAESQQEMQAVTQMFELHDSFDAQGGGLEERWFVLERRDGEMFSFPRRNNTPL